jgi:hypothetical protein
VTWGRLLTLARRPFLLPLFILAVNVSVAWRLFFVQYLDQLPSVEGEFIAMATYIQRHWPGYDWQSLWYAGFPVVLTYQPLVHYTVAVFASLTGLSAASAFHFIGALSYSLGGVAFYYLVKALTGSRRMALGAALCFSLLSPSGILIPAVGRDMGSIWNARRLQALAVYGELPNLTGLMLGMFALGLLHKSLTRRSPWTAVLTAILIAAVPATNWPSTVALIIAILCYLAALPLDKLRDCFPRIAVIGLMATAFALPFALPSTILSTYGNANVMVDLPTQGVRRWLSVGLLLACVFLVRLLLTRPKVSFELRFAAIWLNVVGWVVLSSTMAGVAILPLPLRFHLALEIPLTLAAALLVREACRRNLANQSWLAALFAIFCCVQLYHYQRHAHAMIHKLDITQTLEYQEAAWFDANMHGERALTPGTVQFWMNVFTATPQMTGCCEQSVLTHQDIIAGYVTAAGYQTDAESSDFSMLWMKAFAVRAVAIGGPRSREFYKQFSFPDRYKGRLAVAWSSGDDYIYSVPARVTGLARVVHRENLVSHPPANGIDVAEMRRFVADLDDPSLPAASWKWKDTNSASMTAILKPEHVIAVAVTYHPGWTASVGGNQVSIHSDGLGFVVIEPKCSGPCTVEMHWGPGIEPWIVVPAAMLMLAGALLWCRASKV